MSVGRVQPVSSGEASQGYPLNCIYPLNCGEDELLLFKVITQKVVAINHNKSWTSSGRKESVGGPEGHPNIDC